MSNKKLNETKPAVINPVKLEIKAGQIKDPIKPNTVQIAKPGGTK
jgi:hypothetical protein